MYQFWIFIGSTYSHDHTHTRKQQEIRPQTRDLNKGAHPTLMSKRSGGGKSERTSQSVPPSQPTVMVSMVHTIVSFTESLKFEGWRAVELIEDTSVITPSQCWS